MPTPFFADLIRELCQEAGTGPLMPTGAVPGHRRFAGAVPANTPFHYTVAGIAHPDQWEAGEGRIDALGRLVRDTVAASSSSGATVDFLPGLKTIALTVGASWFAASDAGEAAQDDAIAALEAGLGARQPLSTTHGAVANAAAGDFVTVRRDGGWVNVPVATFPFRDAGGRHLLSGPLGAGDGGAAAPAIGFAADPGCGLFRPGANMIAIATGGTERLRLSASGNLGIGTSTPAAALHVVQPTATMVTVEATNAGATDTQLRIVTPDRDWRIGQNVGGVGVGSLIFYDVTAGAPRLIAEPGGAFRPGMDGGQTLGTAAARWSLLFAATGVINTSDARDKRWRGGASAAEMRAAARIIAELGFYQWNDAIAEKGADGARYHFGVRAQAVWSIMADEGLIAPLDAEGRPGAARYAFLCCDAWDAEGETGPDGARRTARAPGYRFGLRPDQLTLFLIAAQERRLAALEAAA
jgi:hypothetical protein